MTSAPLRPPLRCALALFLALAVPYQALGQQDPPAHATIEKNEDRLRQTISVHFREAPFEDALQEIASRAGFYLAFNPKALPEGLTVTLALEDATVLEALGALSAQTGLWLQISPSGHLIIAQGQERLEAARRHTQQRRSRRLAGAVVGQVTDAATGETLPGATVRVAGTSIGAATDLEGRYRIPNAPAGPQTLVVSYVGYEPEEVPVVVVDGETVEQDIALAFAVVEGVEIVVTAQAEGQIAAINQQRSSNTLVNVVSRDRIQELPDQNAAESVGRLPGVSLQRDGGEGAKVQVRGLDPTFTSVTINGERIPGTDAQDRSVDLSLISTDLLAGIELFKALTPDKDADAIGGTVNLVVANARPGLRGQLRAQGGYGDLRQTYGNVRFNGTLSDRFLDDRLGAVLTANYQTADRSSDVLDDEYEDGTEGYERRSATVALQDEIRDRYGSSLTLDYDLGQAGGIQVRGLYSRTDRDDLRRRTRYRTAEEDMEQQIRRRVRTVDLFSGGLRGEHALTGLGGLGIRYNASYARAENRTPDGYEVRFRQSVFTEPIVDPETGETVTQQGLVYPVGVSSSSIDSLNQLARFSVPDGYLNTFRRERTQSTDRDLTAGLDLTYPVRLGSASVELRGGGKYRTKERVQDDTRYELLGNSVAGVPALGIAEIAQRDGLPRNNFGVSLLGFADPGAGNDPVFGGALGIFDGIDIDALDAFDARNDAEFLRNPFFDRNDFEASEAVAAGYGMAEVTAGPLVVVGGVRYEHTATDYTGRVSRLRSGLGQQLASDLPPPRDTTGQSNYGLWFPQVVTRATLGRGLILRAAVTRTLARPDYLDLVFRENINDLDAEVERGNPDLLPTKAWNYDLGLSRYGGPGLVAAGVFYKRLEDFFYDTEFREVGGPFNNYRIYQTVNGEDATVYGVELEAQLNFTFLPGALSGFLLNTNYAYTESQAEFPVQIPDRFDLDTGLTSSRVETRIEDLPGQSPHVFNASLGYERGGFSGRLSVNYQSAFPAIVRFPVYAFTFRDIDPETGQINATEVVPVDVLSRPYTFVDLQVTQTLPVRLGQRLRLVASLNNILNQRETEARATGEIVADEEYGFTADLGIRLDF